MKIYLVVRHDDGLTIAVMAARLTYDEAESYCLAQRALFPDDPVLGRWGIEEFDMPLVPARKEVTANG